MRWYRAQLFGQAITGKDKTGTDIAEPCELRTCMVRKAPVSPELQEIAGNDEHEVVRCFLTKLRVSQFALVKSFEVQGKHYELIDIADLESGDTLITGRRDKAWPQ